MKLLENNVERLAHYQKNGFIEEAKKDVHWYIRLNAYRALGWEEKAKEDAHREIRLAAHKALGWDEKAKEDEYWEIRLVAYRALGWEEKAKEDKDWNIRLEAEFYFSLPDALYNRINPLYTPYLSSYLSLKAKGTSFYTNLVQSLKDNPELKRYVTKEDLLKIRLMEGLG